MKRYLIATSLVALLFLTGCELKNNSVTDNDDNANMTPTTSPEVKYQTTICKKEKETAGVEDKSVYTIKHIGDNIKSIHMQMHYKLSETGGKTFFDENKSVLTNITDKFKDVIGITTNVIEDSAQLIKAEVNLEVDKLSDSDMMKFEHFKVSKTLSDQKKHFQEKGIKCN